MKDSPPCIFQNQKPQVRKRGQTLKDRGICRKIQAQPGCNEEKIQVTNSEVSALQPGNKSIEKRVSDQITSLAIDLSECP